MGREIFFSIGSYVEYGRLSAYSVESLRNIRQFFGVTFKIVPAKEKKQVVEMEIEEQEEIEEEESQKP